MTWAIMAVSFYSDAAVLSALAALGAAAAIIALGYMAFTLDSAYQHTQGRGGYWKGRAQADVGSNMGGV